MKRIGKQNRNVGQEHLLRRSIPFRLSSILKASNRLEEKVTLAKVSQKYQVDKMNSTKRPNTPLIQANKQKKRNSVLFLKNTRPSLPENTQTLNHCKSSMMKISMYQSHESCIDEQNYEEMDNKLFDLISLIHEDNKKPLNRCQSSASLFFKPSKAPLILNHKKKNDEIFLPQPTSSYYCIENEENIQNITQFEQTPKKKDPRQLNKKERSLVKSTYINGPVDSKVNQKRFSNYLPNKKPQSQQYRLCINCETYVYKSFTLQHEKKCVGFSIILKMKNSQLIDFLDDKINQKLIQLRKIQESLKSPRDKSSKIKNPGNLSLYQEKNRIDKIINDLDSIRLKALKRFHLKTLPV